MRTPIAAFVFAFPLVASATDHGHVVSITNSPLHLAAPGIVEMTGEYAINRRLGAALVAGYGTPVFETVMYLRIEGFEEEGGIQGEAEGYGIGPFIGYKKTARFGLTFDMQLGYQYFAVRAEARDDEGNEASGTGNDSGVLLNLNLGWAF